MAHRTYSLYTNGSGIISLPIAIRTYTLYTSGSEKVSLHMSNMPNEMLLYSEHIPIYWWFINHWFAHLKHAK